MAFAALEQELGIGRQTLRAEHAARVKDIEVGPVLAPEELAQRAGGETARGH